jgi:hypothetical protein
MSTAESSNKLSYPLARAHHTGLNQPTELAAAAILAPHHPRQPHRLSQTYSCLETIKKAEPRPQAEQRSCIPNPDVLPSLLGFLAG